MLTPKRATEILPLNRINELRPFPRLRLLSEARVVFEIISLWLSLPRIRKEAPKGGGQPVLVVPGFATQDCWTSKLRNFIASIGYQAKGCELGRIGGEVSDLIPMLIRQTERFVEESNARVRLVGWSLGGYLAREAARDRPDLVEKVITLGTPVVGGPKYTASARILKRRGYDIEAMAAEVRQRQQTPIQPPIAAIFSRIDGVVTWEACIDHKNRKVEHFEVISSHLGLIFNPEVYRLVAELLDRVEPDRLTLH
jgi:pimeloyl-ACP methyl ester carboxylesterase